MRLTAGGAASAEVVVVEVVVVGPLQALSLGIRLLLLSQVDADAAAVEGYLLLGVAEPRLEKGRRSAAARLSGA